MNNVLGSTQDLAYRIDTDLNVSTTQSGIQRVSLDDLAQEEALRTKLGVLGWGRIQYFRNHFDTGWGDKGQGKALSPRAFEAVLRFVKQMDFPRGANPPSVFLTDMGGIELCWEDGANQPVQVEFGSNGVEYFKGSTQAEGFVDYTNLTALVDVLQRDAKRHGAQ